MTSAWIRPDETAKEALARILTERPSILLPPPLHRLHFRPGNVVEILGPSPSAKTLLLIHAAVTCILPKEWNCVQYGGLERPVLFVDLDCRFDVRTLSRALQRRIAVAGSAGLRGGKKGCDEELFAACMRRFLYVRCYSSSEFLASLKTMHHWLQKEKETQASGVYMLIVDSIGAFYWMDRASSSSSSSSGSTNSKSLTLQTVAETVVHEIKKLLRVHPMLVLAARSALFSNNTVGGPHNLTFREYMPSVWQSFVTHRILLQASDGHSNHQNHPVFSTQWLLPSAKFSDNFVVAEDGLVVV